MDYVGVMWRVLSVVEPSKPLNNDLRVVFMIGMLHVVMGGACSVIKRRTISHFTSPHSVHGCHHHRIQALGRASVS